MIKALAISLFLWVVIDPDAVGSFLILRSLLGSDPVLYFFLVFFAVWLSALAAVLGPVLFPLIVATEYEPSFENPQIFTSEEERSADTCDVEVRS